MASPLFPPSFGVSLSLIVMGPILSLLLLLVAVAFFTLLERKVLAYIMLRRGPNKPSLFGLLTPFADALKLLSKAFNIPTSASHFLISISCLLMFIVPSCLWTFVPFYSSSWSWSFSLLGILVFLSLSVFALLAAGWGSNCKYAILGGIRCIAQSLSYEVLLSLLCLLFCLFSTFNLLCLHSCWGLLTCLHLIFIFFLTVLAETNRSPFDFAEGESELVSGYNLEFSGPGFVVLFLSEYLSILFMSTIVSCLASDGSTLIILLLGACFAFVFIWVRGTMPRFRYDQLMYLS